MRYLIKYSGMFIILVLLQVLILNQIQLGGFVNPYIYILFVLLLPLNTPKYLVMILGFLVGLCIDVFSNTLGIHAAATVFIAYLRPFVIRIISTREEDRSNYPGLFQNRLLWFVYYVSVMVILHHLVLFYLEIFTFAHFFKTLYQILLSSVLSITVIILSQLVIFRR